MNSYDILYHLFDHLHTYQRGSSRMTLASCARVCRAWQEPASYVLWRNLAALHPLWNLLTSRYTPSHTKWRSPFWQFIDVDDFVNNIIAREKERWVYFLHRASHVREVRIVACGPNELALIRALTEYNKGKSLLPSLQRLSWRHVVPSDISILFLSPPCLRDLEIATSTLHPQSGITAKPIVPEGLPHVDPIFMRLAEGAPLLHRLIVTGRQGPGPAIIPHLLRLTHLRELLLYNRSIVLNPEKMGAVLRHMGNLETLDAFIIDFVNSGLTTEAPSLRVLRLEGDLLDVQALLAGYLDAPFLHSLTLKAPDGHRSRISQIFPLIAQANFTRHLRSISVTLFSDRSDVDWREPASYSYSTVIQPLFALKDLQDVHVCLVNCLTPFKDVDVEVIARAWNQVQKLNIAYVPVRSYARPPLTSLQHFVNHCPQLRQLSVSKLAIPAVLDLPPIFRPEAHPLLFLDLKVAFAHDSKDRLEKAAIARYLNYLFPNLVLRHEEMRMGEGDQLQGMSLWQEVEQEIWLLKESRKRQTVM